MYTAMKRSNFLILSNRRTLEAKDEAAKAHNRALYEQYESRGLSIPEGGGRGNGAPRTHQGLMAF